MKPPTPILEYAQRRTRPTTDSHAHAILDGALWHVEYAMAARQRGHSKPIVDADVERLSHAYNVLLHAAEHLVRSQEMA